VRFRDREDVTGGTRSGDFDDLRDVPASSLSSWRKYPSWPGDFDDLRDFPVSSLSLRRKCPSRPGDFDDLRDVPASSLSSWRLRPVVESSESMRIGIRGMGDD